MSYWQQQAQIRERLRRYIERKGHVCLLVVPHTVGGEVGLRRMLDMEEAGTLQMGVTLQAQDENGEFPLMMGYDIPMEP